jgi:hypothetical protein
MHVGSSPDDGMTTIVRHRGGGKGAGSTMSKILFITPPYHCGVVEVAGRWI